MNKWNSIDKIKQNKKRNRIKSSSLFTTLTLVVYSIEMYWKLLVKFSCNLYKTLASIRLLSMLLIILISNCHNMCLNTKVTKQKNTEIWTSGIIYKTYIAGLLVKVVECWNDYCGNISEYSYINNKKMRNIWEVRY